MAKLIGIIVTMLVLILMQKTASMLGLSAAVQRIAEVAESLHQCALDIDEAAQ